MKWLEGWVGAVGGIAGLVMTAIFSITSPYTLNMQDVYSRYYATTGGLLVGAQWIRLLTGLPSITATVLFACALWGLWLDINGQRTRGRILLLGGGALLFLMPYFSPSPAAMLTLMPAIPFAALTLAAGALACLRRESAPSDAR
ncbi:MAG TPA: hypothetical protein VFN78_08665 [Ktedonobacterales bacterium]|nr:hypothetical protein [Ktedonobacterales bacterium]